MDPDRGYNYLAKTVTVQDFSKICRTCCSENELSPIFGSTVNDLQVVYLLEQSVSLQINQNDSMPSNICSTCITELYRIFQFKKQCRDSESALQLVLQSVPNKPLQTEEPDELQDLNRCDIILQIEPTENVRNASQTENDTRDDTSEIEINERHIEENITPQKEHCEIKVTKRIRSKLFKCKVCQREYSCGSELKAHQKQTKHPIAPFRVCAYCKKWISTGKEHICSYQDRPHKCDTCQYQFKRRGELTRHVMRHTGERPHICEVCGKGFIQASYLQNHMRSHTKEKPFKCSMCPSQFSLQCNLSRHLMTHSGKRPHLCDVCGKGFIRAESMLNHKKIHSTVGNDDKIFTCQYCGRDFKKKGCFNIHLQKHTSQGQNLGPGIEKESILASKQVQKYVCEICQKAFKTKAVLTTHQLTHGDKSYVCNVCGKGFIKKFALQSHIRVHTGERPYTCITCKKSFAHQGTLETHMLIHLDRKPHKCMLCFKSFTQWHHLSRHLRTHSGERPFSCSYCGKRFALKCNLTVHTRTHTGETPYLCTICGKGFYDSSRMKKHRLNHRNGDETQRISTVQSEISSPQVVSDEKEDLMNASAAIIPLLVDPML